MVVVDRFEAKAELLSVMANAQRLRVLTTLSEGEMAVGNLAERIGLSQSALSQHLARLRATDLVKTRRDAQTIYYSVKSEKVGMVLELLERMFQAEPVLARPKVA
jgi:DNA-binding transcriptional ArsR family regulator